MTALEPQVVYGIGYSLTCLNPQITITDAGGQTFSGPARDAFDKFLGSLTHEAPFVSLEAKELGELWVSGHGFSDRAMLNCASLGVQVSL